MTSSAKRRVIVALYEGISQQLLVIRRIQRNASGSHLNIRYLLPRCGHAGYESGRLPRLATLHSPLVIWTCSLSTIFTSNLVGLNKPRFLILYTENRKGGKDGTRHSAVPAETMFVCVCVCVCVLQLTTPWKLSLSFCVCTSTPSLPLVARRKLIAVVGSCLT